MKFLKKLLDLGEKLMRFIAALCLCILVAAVSAGVFSRRVLNALISWTEELSTILFIYLSFACMAVATVRKKHIVVDFLTNRLSLRQNARLYLGANGLILVFLAIVVVGALQLQTEASFTSSVMLKIPKRVYYIPVLVSSLYMLLFYIYDTIEEIGNLTYKNQEGNQ